MTNNNGPRPGHETRSNRNEAPKSYFEGTTGLEQRDAILAALRDGGHHPYTNSDNGYMWFVSCPNHTEMVRISSGKTIELACLTWRQDERCTVDDLVNVFGIRDLVPTATSYADILRAALVDTSGLDDIPDPEPLIGDDILFRDSLAWMVGKPGSGKSFVALDIAGCVGTGESWQGYKVTQGLVLYLVAEGVRGTKQRVRAWEHAMGHTMANVKFLPVAVQAKVPAQWDALVTVASELRPVLLIVDTQARTTVGVEENSNTAMGEFIDQAERIRTATGACVLIVHHIGRTGDTGRGATTVDGAMSTIVKVTKVDDQVSLECQKSKDGPAWDDIVMRIVPMLESVVLVPSDGPRRASRTDVLDRAWIRDWWRVHQREPISVTTLVKSGVTTETTFHRSKLELMELGLVVREGFGNSTRYRLTSDPTAG